MSNSNLQKPAGAKDAASQPEFFGTNNRKVEWTQDERNVYFRVHLQGSFEPRFFIYENSYCFKLEVKQHDETRWTFGFNLKLYGRVTDNSPVRLNKNCMTIKLSKIDPQLWPRLTQAPTNNEPVPEWLTEIKEEEASAEPPKPNA